jgi:hypothetical protein
MHLAHCMVLAIGLATSGSVAHAAPKRTKVAHPHVPAPVEDEVVVEDEEDEAPPRKHALASRPDEADQAEETDETDQVEAPAVARHMTAAHDWTFAIGPYLWASSVDANVSLGSSSVSTGVDFLDITHHAKYGVELVGEARYRKFSFSGDLMYGVVGLGGDRALGPLMVSVDGTATSLLVDGMAGYMVSGTDTSAFAIEARAGLRYQRTAVGAAVMLDDAMIASTGQVDAARDVVAGTRIFLRPFKRLYATAAGDVRALGTSNNTWSATADASLRLGSRFLLSLGYRMLTSERANVSMRMHGPRAALQVLF